MMQPGGDIAISFYLMPIAEGGNNAMQLFLDADLAIGLPAPAFDHDGKEIDFVGCEVRWLAK